MPSRPQSWTITEKMPPGAEDPVFDVIHGRNPVSTGLSSLGSARTIVADHLKPGERVWHEDDSDGYRTELTDSFPAPEEPAKSHQGSVHPFDPERPARSRYLARYGRSSRPGKWV